MRGRTLLVAITLLLVVATGCETRPPSAPSDASLGGDAGAGDAGPLDAGLDGGVDAFVPAVCPPVGPYSNGVGDIARDVRLMDCDGVEHSLHELCESEAIWIFEYAQWCPPCRDFARDHANQIYARFRDQGVSAWMVISENNDFDPADATLCATVRERYGIEMPVLFDPEGRLQSTFAVAPNEVQLLMSRGGRIEWKGRYAGSQVEGRIEQLLAR